MQPPRNLYFIGSQHHLAFVIAQKRFSETDSIYDVVVVNGYRPSKAISSLLKQLGIKVISLSQAYKVDYTDLFLMPSNILFSNTSIFLKDVNYMNLIFCGDGFRNGVFYDPNFVLPKKIIYWGFQLLEKSFWDEVDNNLDGIHIEVVPFESVRQAWNQLMSVVPEQVFSENSNFKQNDCALILRHWGNFHYGLKTDSSLQSIIGNYISQANNIRRLVVKDHPLMENRNYITDLVLQENIRDAGVAVIGWENLFDFPSENSWLVNPESLILTRRFGNPKYLIAFDSSLNVLASIFLKETEIIWPDSIDLTEKFACKRTSSIVKEQSNWMKKLVGLSEHSLAGKVVEVDGYATSALINDVYLKQLSSSKGENPLYTQLTQERDALTQERDALTQERDALTQERDALTQERDALTQERDALTQERDALTQERDALTQERDALTQERDALTQERDALTQERDALTQERDALKNSTIWRVTWPLRKIRNVLKN